MVIEQYFLLAAIVVAAVAAFTDYRTGHIPNWLTLSALAAAPLAHAVRGYYDLNGAGVWAAVGFSALGALVCGAIPLLIFVASHEGAISGGDVKLLAALGAICLVDVGIEVEFMALIAVAVIAMARFAYEGKLLGILGRTVSLVVNPFRKREQRQELSSEMLTSMRFAPPALVGVVAAVFINWRDVTW